MIRTDESGKVPGILKGHACSFRLFSLKKKVFFIIPAIENGGVEKYNRDSVEMGEVWEINLIS